MYRAKELGRNRVQIFTASMNERYARRLALEQNLHHAIERNQLTVLYQPIYDRTRRRITSVEALVRWNDPVRGMVEPSEFISLASPAAAGEGVANGRVRALRAGAGNSPHPALRASFSRREKEVVSAALQVVAP